MKCIDKERINDLEIELEINNETISKLQLDLNHISKNNKSALKSRTIMLIDENVELIKERNLNMINLVELK